MAIKRTFKAKVEARSSEDTPDRLNVVGHAAVFNQRTLIGSRQFGFVEEIDPGAFDDVLDHDARFLINHEGMTLARVKNGTLRMSTDSIGLVSDADLNPDMQIARDLFAAIQRGDIDQMSFAFTILDDEVRQLPDDDEDFPGMTLRRVTKVQRMFDNSAVTYPAYEGADISARSAEMNREEISAVLTRGASLDEVQETEPTTVDDSDAIERLLDRHNKRTARK